MKSFLDNLGVKRLTQNIRDWAESKFVDSDGYEYDPLEIDYLVNNRKIKIGKIYRINYSNDFERISFKNTYKGPPYLGSTTRLYLKGIDVDKFCENAHYGRFTDYFPIQFKYLYYNDVIQNLYKLYGSICEIRSAVGGFYRFESFIYNGDKALFIKHTGSPAAQEQIIISKSDIKHNNIIDIDGILYTVYYNGLGTVTWMRDKEGNETNFNNYLLKNGIQPVQGSNNIVKSNIDFGTIDGNNNTVEKGCDDIEINGRNNFVDYECHYVKIDGTGNDIGHACQHVYITGSNNDILNNNINITLKGYNYKIGNNCNTIYLDSELTCLVEDNSFCIGQHREKILGITDTRVIYTPINFSCDRTSDAYNKEEVKDVISTLIKNIFYNGIENVKYFYDGDGQFCTEIMVSIPDLDNSLIEKSIDTYICNSKSLLTLLIEDGGIEYFKVCEPAAEFITIHKSIIYITVKFDVFGTYFSEDKRNSIEFLKDGDYDTPTEHEASINILGSLIEI